MLHAIDFFIPQYTYNLTPNFVFWFFLTDNLIGKGGSGRVYKGFLPDGQPIAVKLQKASQGVWRDFLLEVDILTSLQHEHVVPLIGICVKDNYLISVYTFISKGTLEENLHGNFCP